MCYNPPSLESSSKWTYSSSFIKFISIFECFTFFSSSHPIKKRAVSHIKWEVKYSLFKGTITINTRCIIFLEVLMITGQLEIALNANAVHLRLSILTLLLDIVNWLSFSCKHDLMKLIKRIMIGTKVILSFPLLISYC